MSSDTSPSAQSLTSSNSQTVLTNNPRNVTTQPTRPMSNIFDTSSTISSSTSSNTNRPPISEIPITPPSHSHSSPTQTPLVHIPNPESVAKYIDYKPQNLGTAFKTARILPPQLDIVQIPKTTYNTDHESITTSQKYPTLKPLKKLSTSTIEHNDINTHKTQIVQYIYLNIDTIFVFYLIEDSVLIHLLFISLHYLVVRLHPFLDYTLNRNRLKHTRLNLLHILILRLVLTLHL